MVSIRVRKNIAKYTGISLNEVDILLKNPVINKNQIKSLRELAIHNSKYVSIHMRNLITTAKEQMQKLKDKFNADKKNLKAKDIAQMKRTIRDLSAKLKKQLGQDPQLTELEPKHIVQKLNDPIPIQKSIVSNHEPRSKFRSKCEPRDPIKPKCRPKCNLELECGCAPSIPIGSVPFICSNPGTYCVTKNLTWGGSGSAISITSSNVEINFENFKLTLSSPTADSVGISISNVSSVKIHNGEIQGNVSNLNQIGINAYNGLSIGIFDMLISNIAVGINSDISSDISVDNICLGRPVPQAPIVLCDTNASDSDVAIPDPCWNYISGPVDPIGQAWGLNGYIGATSDVFNSMMPAGTYKYRQSFNLSSINPPPIINCSEFIPLNTANVYLNGTLVAGPIAPYATASFVLTSGFNVGQNNLDVEVIVLTPSQSSMSMIFGSKYLPGINAIVMTMSNKINIQNITINEFTSGISVLFCEETLIDQIQGFKTETDGINEDSKGIDGTNSLDIAIRGSQFKNYFIGISSENAINLVVDGVEIGADESYENPANIALDATGTIGSIIKNVQIQNYFRGIQVVSTITTIIDFVNIYADIAFDSESNAGIFGISSINLSTGNINVENYFIGIEVSSSDTFSIIDAKFHSDVIIIDSFNQAIHVDNSLNVNIQNVQIRNYYGGIGSIFTDIIMTENVEILIDTHLMMFLMRYRSRRKL